MLGLGLVGPSGAGRRLHVQVLGAHVTRVEAGEEIRPEGKPLAWQLFELAASYPPGDATVPLIGQLVWPELDVTEEQVARRICSNLHDLQAIQMSVASYSTRATGGGGPRWPRVSQAGAREVDPRVLRAMLQAPGHSSRLPTGAYGATDDQGSRPRMGWSTQVAAG